MKSGWEVIYKEVERREYNSPSWKSDRKHLLEIIEWADQHDLEPVPISKFEITKFRTIVKAAKKATVLHDVELLQELFNAVATKNIIDLRHLLGICEVETISYEIIDGGTVTPVRLELRTDQFERIRLMTKARFIFEQRKDNNLRSKQKG